MFIQNAVTYHITVKVPILSDKRLIIPTKSGSVHFLTVSGIGVVN